MQYLLGTPSRHVQLYAAESCLQLNDDDFCGVRHYLLTSSMASMGKEFSSQITWTTFWKYTREPRSVSLVSQPCVRWIIGHGYYRQTGVLPPAVMIGAKDQIVDATSLIIGQTRVSRSLASFLDRYCQGPSMI